MLNVFTGSEVTDSSHYHRLVLIQFKFMSFQLTYCISIINSPLLFKMYILSEFEFGLVRKFNKNGQNLKCSMYKSST